MQGGGVRAMEVVVVHPWRKRSANPSIAAAMKLRTSCPGNQPAGRGGYGSTACASGATIATRQRVTNVGARMQRSGPSSNRRHVSTGAQGGFVASGRVALRTINFGLRLTRAALAVVNMAESHSD